MEKQQVVIAPPSGRLGVLLVGLGAVSTTFIAGVEAVRRGIGQPFGSLTQIGRIRLGKRTEHKNPLIRELVPLADLNQLAFACWDPIPDNAYEAARKAGVIDGNHCEPLRDFLEAHRPMPAVFDQSYVRKLEGRHVKKGRSKRDLADQVVADIEQFIARERVDRCVMIWCGSTEVYTPVQPVHQNLRTFEAGLEKSDPGIAPSLIYAYAALKLGIPFANGAPNLTVDTPALQELAAEKGVPIAGKDFKTGQTLMKTILAPGLRARLLGISGWYSTNILGNRDGEVLDDP
ncbi:MAG: inositol-3-phosphate synthase, partial [Deltaproteobacteria bacterium]|nr:inositol-3-phosphate synthase [Deltaproteobacteria bacterium]